MCCTYMYPTLHNFPRGCRYIKSFKYIGLGVSCKQGLLIRDVDGDNHDVSLCCSSVQGIDINRQFTAKGQSKRPWGPIPAIPNQLYKFRVLLLTCRAFILCNLLEREKEEKKAQMGFAQMNGNLGISLTFNLPAPVPGNSTPP
jgi:hypothetical protein